MPKAAVCVRALDRLIARDDYVAGDAVTIADLMLAPQLEFLAITPEGKALLEPYPRLPAWLARMQERPSMRATTWEKVSKAA